MSKIFTKNGFRGFTLIELLVVIAIIGLLSTVIAAPITQARKKGRDGKKVADLHQIQGSLQQYADDHNGNYPSNISEMLPLYLSALPPFAATSTSAKDKYMYVSYTTASDGRTIGFHLGVKLEAASQALQDDRDCYGAGSIVAGVNYCVEKSADANNLIAAASSSAFATDGTSLGLQATDLNAPGVPALEQVAPTDAVMTGMQVGAYDFGGGMDLGNTACTAAVRALNNGGAASSTVCIYDITN